MSNLPKLLKREPLVDAVFEVRLDGPSMLTDVVPGALFRELDPKPTIQRLPTADIPQQIRASVPEFQFALTRRMEWDGFFILVGDRNFLVSCKLPYPRWPRFKEMILDVTRRVADAGIDGTVGRYSLQYVNLIQAPTPAEQVAKIKMGVDLGRLEARDDQVNVQIHRKEGDTCHILSIATGAARHLPGEEGAAGVVVTVDSIRAVDHISFAAFAESLSTPLESLRRANKEQFFGCLQESTVQEMGPVYE